MPKAEVGSTKHLSNKMKQRGLTRLRFYCQTCVRALRDENSFKQHCLSESHFRAMALVGEDPKKFINDFSKQFEKDFIQQLRTGHGEKQISLVVFYNTFIAQKDHIHMNATKWPNLTEFAKHLGREGICRVEETDKGLQIAWIDDSPEALRRKDALRRKEMQDKGDEEREQRMIREQIRRANKESGARDEEETDAEAREERGLQRQEGEKVKLSFGAKPNPLPESTSPAKQSSERDFKSPENAVDTAAEPTESEALASNAPRQPAGTKAPISMKMGTAKPQPKNVFATAKKNALGGTGGSKKASAFEQPKKMSEAERIMKEEMERKRARESSGGSAHKRQRI